MDQKELYLAHLNRGMADFGKFPEDLKAKVMANMQTGTYKTERKENHEKFFAEADKNGDGMLDQAEWNAYQALWKNHIQSKFGQEVPENPETVALAFDAHRASGKEGVTKEDFETIVVWADEAMASMMPKEN
mmetsp:Transcript_30295/g.41056  ORF Transcript_30295/g.41056 Transcript_30295/m.41056 type:complete len:132 (-) Transcript_30295:75-470(-)|eukprot:CAMPEP_0176366526 /NCGR_PEP_ID=MMETSP0126-20121128/21245_1 /TAXON_ID=141414 ORGANISM="Strombidinopsis acuminatum, Strain SPMC142" /NCGR_SAMPLE_ID=MMETSP0126 /ASSEMBLY_ACC=CAM_ASM_000229 /LENGTH=131 /DNA_ID=CAMNT_0017723989 /DNA_START=36 /DNA_END=431 /DNA_ORIENTATION=-